MIFLNRTSGALGILCASVAIAPQVIHAQPPAEQGEMQIVQEQPEPEAETPAYDPELDEAARLTFVRAREAFDAGDYEAALQRFRQAYELSPRPTLLYNIAATLDRLRRDEETAEALRAYLEALPDAHDRAEVEARLRVLDQTLGERRQREAAEEAERQRAAEELERQRAEQEAARLTAQESTGGLHPAIAIGVGGAAVLAGGLIIWSGLNANSRNDDYVAYATAPGARREPAEALYNDVRSAERRTNALIGVAAALGAASAVLFVFTDFGGGDEDSVAVGVAPTPDGGAISLGGSF